MSLGSQQGGDLPVFLRLETLDFAFALHDQPHRHGLHAPRAQSLGYLGTQQRTQLVADHAVEETARFLGGDAIHVDGRRLSEGFLNGSLGDLVKGDAVRLLVLETQGFFKVPGDRLALAVGVGGQVNGRRLGRLLLEGGN